MKLQISKIKPINNMVVVKTVIDDAARPYGKSGLILGKTAKDQYLKNYTHRHFEVVYVPDKLYFPSSKYDFASSGCAFRYRTDMELQVGDMVWVKLRSGHRAMGIIADDGQKYYFIHYANCYVAQRRSHHNEMGKQKQIVVKDEAAWEVIPLNGNIICDKLYKKPFSSLHIKDKVEDLGKLKVKFTGSHSPSYFTIIRDEFKEIELPETKLRRGMIVQADGPFMNVEGEYFHDFNGISQPVTIHRTNIASVIHNYPHERT
jgi:hypothetical protein